MKYLVTGGAGFIGSHLARRLLADGHSVCALDNFNDFYDPAIKRRNIEALREAGGDFDLVEGDLLDADLLNGMLRAGRFDAVLHLAARAGVRPSIERPDLYIETNIRGTHLLLEAARQAGCEQFIFASSSSVYGLCQIVPFVESEALPQTLSPYAATKIAGEHLCGNFSSLYGMRVVCLRFFTVYGPGQRPDLAIAKFARQILAGEPIPKFGEGLTRRDYTYIDDIVAGVLGALAYRGPLFDIFNLGESETTTLNELIALLEENLGRQAVIRQLPEQKGDMPLTCADISKARRLLGYNPGTKIREGIPKYTEWLRACPTSL